MSLPSAKASSAPTAAKPDASICCQQTDQNHVDDAEDIANGILFLAGDASKCMTGSELVIDGGFAAH